MENKIVTFYYRRSSDQVVIPIEFTIQCSVPGNWGVQAIIPKSSGITEDYFENDEELRVFARLMSDIIRSYEWYDKEKNSDCVQTLVTLGPQIFPEGNPFTKEWLIEAVVQWHKFPYFSKIKKYNYDKFMEQNKAKVA